MLFSFLFFNGDPISCHIRLVHRYTVYFLESAYDLEYKKYGPTTILRANVINHVIDRENAAIIRTIKGDEAYKRDWTPNAKKRRGLSVFNKNSKGYVLTFLATIILPSIEKHQCLLWTKRIFQKSLMKK